MRIFNEETQKKNGDSECLILASWDEVKTLHEIMDAAIAANPRKRSWKTLREKLELLAVY